MSAATAGSVCLSEILIPFTQQLLWFPGALNTIRTIREPVLLINALQHNAVTTVLALFDARRVGKNTEQKG